MVKGDITSLNYESNRNANYNDLENTTVTWLQLLPSSLPHPRSGILSLELPVVMCEFYCTESQMKGYRLGPIAHCVDPAFLPSLALVH